MKSLIAAKKYFKDGKLLTGFTMIELIVVIAVFMFIIGAAVGIFLSIVQNQKKLLSEEQLLNQISYIEEYMSKAMRMATKDLSGNCLIDNSPTSPFPGKSYPGYNYLLTRPFTTGPAAGFFTGIKFFNQSDNICQEFYWDTTQGVLEEVRGSASPIALTPSSMQINSIKFSINGTGGCYGGGTCPFGDQDLSVVNLQPRITMLLNVKISGDSQEPNRTIQTTVSQRNLNVAQ
jgi:type II secretory pathway pseudopilin PulG